MAAVRRYHHRKLGCRIGAFFQRTLDHPRPLKLLFISQEFPPDTNWGGIGTYAGIITPLLAERGLDVHVLSVVPGQVASDKVVEGVHIHRRPLRRPRGVGRVLRLPETWRRISLALAVYHEARRLEINFDVCETPEWQAEGLAIALRNKVPLVVRLHSGAEHVFPHLRRDGIDEWLAVRCERALIRRGDVVTGTPAIVASVANDLGLSPESVRPIIYPVHPAPSAHPPPAGPPRILFAGRLEPRKAPDVLIKAAPTVLTRYPEARFVLAGADAGGADGRPFVEHLRSLASRLAVAHAVEFAGRRGGPDTVAEELAVSTMCVMPSRWESMGYVAAEAAALARPVVASRIPALEAIVDDGHTGRLVAPGDPRALAQAIIELLAMPESQRQEMGNAGRRLIAKRCDPERIANETLAAYELAIERRNRREPSPR